MLKNRKIEVAIRLLKKNGYGISEPTKEPEETQYQKAIHTGVKPAIWPPLLMTPEDLQHFRETHGLA